MKDIIKVIRSLENRWILPKGTTEKVIRQEGGLLSDLLSPLMKVGSPLMKNVLASLAKSFLIPLELTTAASATDAAIWKKIMNQVWLDWQRNEKYHEKSQISWRTWFDMLLGALSARLLGNLSAGKEVIRGEGTIRDGQGFKCRLHL